MFIWTWRNNIAVLMKLVFNIIISYQYQLNNLHACTEYFLQTIQSIWFLFQITLQTGQIHSCLSMLLSFFGKTFLLFICFYCLFWFQFWLFLFRIHLNVASFWYLFLGLLPFSFEKWTRYDFRWHPYQFVRLTGWRTFN